MDIDSGPKVMGDDGEFHVVDEAVDLSDTPIEGWLALGLFWVLGIVVFTQFFTRYVLNDSASWTEEIARYLLVGTVFVGAGIGVAQEQPHPGRPAVPLPARRPSRGLSTAVDLMRLAFFAAMSVFTAQMMGKLQGMQMSVVDLPMNIVYGVCLLGLASMTLRSIWVAKRHWQRGYSVLERPESTMQDR